MKSLGPPNARIAILLDFPTKADLAKGELLSGWDSSAFWQIAQKNNILRSCVYIACLLPSPPPDEDIATHISSRKTCPGEGWKHIHGRWISPEVAANAERIWGELEALQPTLVITLGPGALWALTGDLAALKWRGSRVCPPGSPYTVVPMLAPRQLAFDPSAQVLFEIDLKRAQNIFTGEQIPRAYDFSIEPTFFATLTVLNKLLIKASERPIILSGDLETRQNNMTCLGIAWSATEAICIPLITTNDEKPFYWPEQEETAIVALILQLFTHPNVTWVGQNFLYDCQFFHRHWGVIPLRCADTMIGHHSIFANLRKGLDFLSSMYAHDHVYWKDEIKNWDAAIGEKQYWTYNCKDACITWEIWFEIYESACSKKLADHFAFQQSLFSPVLRMMNRGIRLDETARAQLRVDLIKTQFERQETLNLIAGHELNPKSPAQLSKFFYDDLGIPGVKNLTGDSFTTNSSAMVTISEREPALRPLCQLILELRSIGVFLSTFINAPLDIDKRMRCSFSIAGPITYRFSSSENAFGSGMNLQNIPVAEKQKIKSTTYIKLPNIRKLFIPDQGMTFFDMDLDRADLQVVIWEAEDEDMKKALKLGLDMHCVNACDVFEIKGIPYDELQENHSNYKEHRARIGEGLRGKTKAGVHATNYGVGDSKLAQTLGITKHEASRFRARWFSAHPGIRRWHIRTEELAGRQGYIENKFGARLYIFGRTNLPELLGWLPQSTVAGVINRALVNIDNAYQQGETSIQLQIQVHDSLAGQFRTELFSQEIVMLKSLSQIIVPYDDPLVIPVGIKTSTKSWGDCK